jgi:SAM-dependent methyltransferase
MRSGLRRGHDHHAGGAQKSLRYAAIERRLPRWLVRHILHFEAAIDDSLRRFSDDLRGGARVLDAGAGEARHRAYFTRQRYVGVDLAVGDAAWDYGKLDVIADVTALPFPAGAFDACINIVTLEHVREPARAVAEMARVLNAAGRLLLIVPHEWEVHQAPHDYFRYTRHGLAHLLAKAGFEDYTIEPVGGYFRLLARRLLNGVQFFPGPSAWIAALFLAPPALALPLLDSLDHERNFTLGYICVARKHG